MRDDLHRAAEEVAAALARDEVLVDGARGEVGVAREVLVNEALVMAEVEVALVAIFGDEHLAVLERAHGTRVHVKIRIGLLHSHPVAACLSRRPSDAAVMPLPSELTTPPVTNICFVMVFTCTSRRNLHRSPALPRDFSVLPASSGDEEHVEFTDLKRKAV